MNKKDSVFNFITMLLHVNIIILLCKIFTFLEFGSIKSLNGLNVLEVGSGRGGGLNYISRYLNPSSCIGVDYSEN